jgi:hypothetical protein
MGELEMDCSPAATSRWRRALRQREGDGHMDLLAGGHLALAAPPKRKGMIAFAGPPSAFDHRARPPVAGLVAWVGNSQACRVVSSPTLPYSSYSQVAIAQCSPM